MAAVYALRRLVDQGKAVCYSEKVWADYGRRQHTVLRMYQVPRPVRSFWPAWLAPTGLPPARPTYRHVSE